VSVRPSGHSSHAGIVLNDRANFRHESLSGSVFWRNCGIFKRKGASPKLRPKHRTRSIWLPFLSDRPSPVLSYFVRPSRVYDAEYPSLCRARWSWHKASSGLSAPAQTCLESPLWSRSHRWRVKLRSHHTKWTELNSSSEHMQTNGNVHSVRAGVHEPCDLVCCVCSQSVQSRSIDAGLCARPINARCNWVNWFSSLRAMWTMLHCLCSILSKFSHKLLRFLIRCCIVCCVSFSLLFINVFVQWFSLVLSTFQFLSQNK